jgi:Do/DeqQ family serine protease
MAQVQLTFAPVVKRVAPAVVNVYARSIVRQQVNPIFSDPLFQQFFGVSPEFRQRVEQSLGSGVIVRADGVILTNNHVVEGGQDIVVALSDKREFKAKVLLADAKTDLAVLKIDTKGEKLPTLDFADSDRVQVGDLVLAIGDPFGVGQTVTMGIVSALARTQVSASDYQFFIQTDAAINPGNSGGALVTMSGQLAGINTAIFSRTGQYAGIGFAIPANLARRVVDGAANGGVQLAWIGADGQPVTADIARAAGLPRPEGVLVKSVYPGGPVAIAGLKTGDVVIAVDGAEVDDMQGLNYRIATHKPGDVVKHERSLRSRWTCRRRAAAAGRPAAAEDPGRSRRPGSSARARRSDRPHGGAGPPHSIILWGPPGTGKTTIARLLSTAFKLHFEQLSAVFSGVADLKKTFEAARAAAQGRGRARCCSSTKSTASTAASRIPSCRWWRTAPSCWSARRRRIRPSS